MAQPPVTSRPIARAPRLVVPASDRLESERPIKDIAADLWNNAAVLLRQELKLGVGELGVRAHALKVELKVAAVGGAMLYVGVLCLVTALILALSKVVESWLAALIVGGAASAIGFVISRREPEAMVDAVMAPGATVSNHEKNQQPHGIKELLK